MLFCSTSCQTYRLSLSHRKYAVIGLFGAFLSFFTFLLERLFCSKNNNNRLNNLTRTGTFCSTDFPYTLLRTRCKPGACEVDQKYYRCSHFPRPCFDRRNILALSASYKICFAQRTPMETFDKPRMFLHACACAASFRVCSRARHACALCAPRRPHRCRGRQCRCSTPPGSHIPPPPRCPMSPRRSLRLTNDNKRSETDIRTLFRIKRFYHI